MFDKKRLEQDIELGNKAMDVYNQPIVQTYFKETREKLTSAWENSHDTDIEGRERLYLSLKLLRGFEHMFKTAMETGKLASETLDKLHRGGFENL